jgi:menaquinone-dependent protoporphyrinogen oxidase
VTAPVHPREHRVLLGAFDPNDPPTSMQERLVRLMPAAKRVLPAGDFREWDTIETWGPGDRGGLGGEGPGRLTQHSGS